jgi:uncharacterized repeat protein (TIGR01451 family)
MSGLSNSPNGDIDAYKFTGTSGEHIVFRVDPNGVNTNFRCVIELYGPSDTLLIRDIDDYTGPWPSYEYGGRQVNFEDYQLPETGQYTLYIREDDGSHTSGYWLSLHSREHLRTIARPIILDTTITGQSISPNGDIDAFTFKGTANENIILRADPAGINTSFRCVIELFGPADTLLAKDIDDYTGPWPSYEYGGREVNILGFKLPEDGVYTIYIREDDGSHNSTYWLSTHTPYPLKLENPLPNQQLTSNGAENYYRAITNANGPIVIKMDKTGTWNSTLRVKKNLLPVTEPFFADAGTGDLSVAVIASEADTFYVQVTSNSNGGEYSMLATADIGQAGNVIAIDNDVIQSQINVPRAAINSLIYKKGSNVNLLSTYLFDLGSDPQLGQYLNKNWTVQNCEVFDNYLNLSLNHPSGFANDMIISWANDQVEMRCDITAPEEVEARHTLRPGGEWQSGRDQWAFPASGVVQTGGYPDPYPANQSWGLPSEGWLALWDNEVDEVYGFTFSGGYQAKITDHQNFLVPSGTSRLTFHVVKPRPSPPYNGIRNLSSGVFLTLASTPDLRYVIGGNEIEYTTIFNNSGTVDATNTIVETTLPYMVEAIEASISNNGTYDPVRHKISWNIGELQSGAAKDTVSFDARVLKGTGNGTEITTTTRIWADEQPIATTAYGVSIVGTPLVQSISPVRGGNTGRVTVTINGTNLDPNAEVKLSKKGEPVIIAVLVTGDSNGSKLTAAFDLAEKPPNVLDLIVTNPNGSFDNLKNAFTIERGYENLWVEIVGADNIRVGRETTFSIRYGNSGNTDVLYPWLALSVPHGVSNETGLPLALASDSLPPPVLPSDSVYDITVIDLPYLSVGSNESINLKITPNQAGPFSIRAILMTDATPFFRSVLTLPDSVNIDSTSNENFDKLNSKIESDFPPIWPANSPYPPPSGYIFFWDYRSGGGSFHFAKSIGGGKYIEMNGPEGLKIRDFDWPEMPLKPYFVGAFRPSAEYNQKHGNTVNTRATNLNNTFKNRNRYQRGLCTSDLKSGPGGDTLVTNCLGLFHILNPEFRAKGLIFADEIYDNLNNNPGAWDRRVGAHGNKSLIHKGKMWWRKIKCWAALEILALGVRREIRALMSIDPNDKFGPLGFDPEGTPQNQLKRFIAPTHSLPYIVHFENVDTATAAAQEIMITDQIENNFDRSSFEFGEIKIGNKSIQIPDGLKSYQTTIDLRPTLSTIVETDCNFDTTTGLVTWLFKGVDPYTGEYADILPPNTPEVAPQGEGWVSYSIDCKPNLPTWTIIKNKATIDFEVGIPPAPLVTPEFVNTIDVDKPESNVLPITVGSYSPNFDVRLHGSDVGAGVTGYTIYVSKGKEPFEVWLTNHPESFATFNPPADSQIYRFYSVAHDGAGNMEEEPKTHDAEIFFIDRSHEKPETFYLSQNYPNPFNPATTIEFGVPEFSRVTVVIYDILGRRVQTLIDKEMEPGRYKQIWNGSSVASGVYFVRMQANKFSEVKRIMLIK